MMPASASAENLRRQEAGVDRAHLADRQRPDGHAGRHLRDRVEAVLAAEHGRRDRHAEHGQRRQRRRHAGQMRGSAGAGDDHLEAACLRRLRVLVQALRGAVRGDDLGLVGDFQLVQDLGRSLQGRPVRLASHYDADDGVPIGHGWQEGPERKRGITGAAPPRQVDCRGMAGVDGGLILGAAAARR